MAASRPHSQILEQPRRRRRWLALSASVVVLAVGSGLLLKREPAPVASHAFTVPPLRGRVQVEVLNGTGKQGAARTATRLLRRRGLDVVFLGNADSAQDSTQVIVRRGDPARARYVIGTLGAGKMVVETDTFRRVDISVILGQDFQPRGDPHP